MPQSESRERGWDGLNKAKGTRADTALVDNLPTGGCQKSSELAQRALHAINRRHHLPQNAKVRRQPPEKCED
jgi:hypothetical protein